jgi:type IV pilus assembly protein PilC
MIEPAMIIVLGIVIGFIVLSIIQPIFSMYDAIGK